MRFSNKHIEISVVAPCLNEEANIPLFLERLDNTMSENELDYEVIVVDDGSTDKSRELLLNGKDSFPLTPIFFSRNYGQQAALLAGIHRAQGEAIVTIDLDLQQPPEVIPELVRGWRYGAKVVHAIPVYNRSASWHKRLTSKLFYRLIKVLDSEVVCKANDFRLIDREVASIIKQLPEKNLYLRGVFSWIGFRQQRVHYVHCARKHGETKYSYTKMIGLAFRGVASQSITPLRIGLFIGILSIGLAVILICWALVVHFIYKQTVAGWTSLVIVLLFFSSINFLLLGIIGEYVGQLFIEVKGRPPYVSQGTKAWKEEENKASQDPIQHSTFNVYTDDLLSSKSALEIKHSKSPILHSTLNKKL